MDAEFLKQHVGDALAKGLAQVVVDRPEDGIDHLGKFLLRYADQQTRASENVTKKANMAEIISSNNTNLEKEAAATETAKAAAAAKQSADDALLEELRNAQNGPSFADANSGMKVQAAISNLMQRCADHVKTRIGASAVYVGRLCTYPEGHAKAGAQYIAYEQADEGSAFMLNNVLDKVDEEGEDRPPASGVTFDVFVPVEEEEEPEPEEGEEPVEKPPKMPRHLHIENVLRNDQVKFFKFPMLGAFLACDVTTKNSLHTGAWNDEYLTASEETESAEAPEGEEGEEAPAEKTEEKEDGAEDAPKPKRVWDPTEVQEGHMVICADTMGQNRPFDAGEISFIHQLSMALSTFVEAITNFQFQHEVWLRREHFQANTALAEKLAADAAAMDAAKEEAMSKVAEDALEEVKALTEKECVAQAAIAEAMSVKEDFVRVMQMRISPGAGVCQAIAALAAMGGNEGVDTVWDAVNKVDANAIFDAVAAYTADSFDTASIEKWRGVLDGVDVDGATAFSAAVGSVLKAARAVLDWSEASEVSKAAIAAAEEAAKEAEAAEEAPADEE
jgi:hypothetical protein